MFPVNLYCYPWDLVDDGIDQVLDRARGEAGVTGITVPVCTPAVIQFRPHAVAPRTFRSPGGCQFQFDPSYYRATRVRPVVAAWLHKTNPLAAVAEGCARRGLDLRAAVSCCHNRVAAEKHQSATVKDVFGDTNPAWLCPSNPDVREYLRGLITELAGTYGIQVIELSDASFPPAPTARAHEQPGFLLGPVGQWVRGLCFCESCRQEASRNGLDPAAVADAARAVLEGILQSGEPPDVTLDSFLQGEPATPGSSESGALLAAYAEWGVRQVSRLLEALRVPGVQIVLQRSGSRLSTDSDFTELARRCDRLMLPCTADEAALDEAVRSAAAETGDPARLEVQLSAGTPPCPDAAWLVRMTSRAERAGLAGASFWNYGLLPLPRLLWIKQAVRLARRQRER